MTLKYCPTPGKLSYSSRSDARKIRNRQRKSRANGEGMLNVYLCECGAWHIGHRARGLERY